MYKRFIFPLKITILILVLLIPVLSANAQSVVREELISNIIFQGIKSWHYNKLQINDEFSEKSFAKYIEFLDYNKRFLLKSDIEEFEKHKLLLDDYFIAGRYDFMELASVRLEQRIQEVKGFYRDFLKKPFKFNIKETFELDSEKREFAANQRYLKRYWRKLLKYNTLIRYMTELKANKKAKKKKSRKFLEKKARESVAKSFGNFFNRLLRISKEEKTARYINALLRVYDPHTSYFPPKDKEDFEIEVSGTFEGIGALLSEENGFIKVVRVVPGGPCWKDKRIGPGDYILKVVQDDKGTVDVQGMSVRDAVKYIRGKKGTKVILTVKKPDGRVEDIDIVRDIVEDEDSFVKSVILKNSKDNKKWGYIVVPGFYNDFKRVNGRKSSEDVKKALIRLKERNVDGIILDLRNNGGGALLDAVKISGFFFDEGPVVQVKGSRGIESLKDPDPATLYKGSLVVLINSLSASASEIVAGALQDYNRAVIVGSKHSFGKGTVQIMADLDNVLTGEFKDVKPLGALKMTIKKFYRVNGGSNQYKGIVPDIILHDPFDYLDIGEKYLDYPLKWDTVKGAEYKLYKDTREDIVSLRERSAERVKKSVYFKSLDSYIDAIKKERESTVQSLKLQDVEKDNRELKLVLDNLKKFSKIDPDLKLVPVSEITGRDKKLVKIEKERRKIWFDSIKEDMILDEAVKILSDIEIKK